MNTKQANTTAPRRPNAGQFRKGHDPRRHVHSATCGHELYKFSAADCSQGFWTSISKFGVSIGPKLHAAGRWPNYRRA